MNFETLSYEGYFCQQLCSAQHTCLRYVNTNLVSGIIIVSFFVVTPMFMFVLLSHVFCVLTVVMEERETYMPLKDLNSLQIQRALKCHMPHL